LEIDRNCCWDTGTEPDHGKVLHASIQKILIKQGCSRNTAKYIATILGAHHGRLKYLPNDRGMNSPIIKPMTESYSGINWDAERQNCAQRILDYFTVDEFSQEGFSGDSFLIWCAGSPGEPLVMLGWGYQGWFVRKQVLGEEAGYV